MAVSELIREARIAAGYSKTTAAIELNMARQTYVDLESGKTEPRYSTIVNLSNAFNRDPSFFFGDEQNQNQHIIDEESFELLAALSNKLFNKSGSRRQSRTGK